MDSLILSVKDLEITPERIREFLPKVNWDRLASMYVAGRTGAECESRYAFPNCGHSVFLCLYAQKYGSGYDNGVVCLCAMLMLHIISCPRRTTLTVLLIYCGLNILQCYFIRVMR